jgi:hypothetical protein
VATSRSTTPPPLAWRRPRASSAVTANEAEAAAGEPESAKEERLRLLAQNGFNPVIAVGFAYSGATGKVAKEFPDTQFAIIDDAGAVGPNIANLTFAGARGLLPRRCGCRSEVQDGQHRLRRWRRRAR